MKSLPYFIGIVLTSFLISCGTPEVLNLTQDVAVHKNRDSRWIRYAGHDFRMGNVLEAKLGKYGYKFSQHTFHAEGDLPTGVTLSTNYPTNFDYNAVLALKKLGANVPNIAGAQIGAERERSGEYKLYVLQAANEREWKNIIRDAIKSGDEDLVEQMRRPDGYFRFVDAVLVMSDLKGKRKIEGKINANATYKSVRAELDARAKSESNIEGTEPRVIGYSLRGACWGPPNYSRLVGTPEDRPAAGDSGECQSGAEHSPVYLGSPPAKR
jgi:hypothetical protein